MRHFFILALGRSGTNFLATLLSSDSRGIVHHEPHRHDPKLVALAQAGTFRTALDSILEERFADLLPKEGEAAFYGEVNSFLRYEVDWLKRRFDPALVFLARDGRDFVRSAYIREVLTPYERACPVVPRDEDPWAASWGAMTRFDRLCWYWMHSNEMLFERLGKPVHFESLLRDYGQFREAILEPTGLEISEATWQREIDSPKNTSSRYAMKRRVKSWLGVDGEKPSIPPIPRWQDWERERTERFWEICGATMDRLGYES